MRGRTALLLAFLLLAGCASTAPPRAHIDEDVYARYYLTQSDRVLRVERDGTVLDVTCLPREFTIDKTREHLPHSLCAPEKIKVLGKVRRTGGDWDMTAFDIQPETGTCRPLLPFILPEWEETRRHSCWHRLWEVPTAALVYPTVAVVAVGLITAPIWVPIILLL